MALPTRSRPVWRSFPDHARPRRAALYASYGLLVGFHTLAFWKTMRRLGSVPVAVSKGTQQALPFLLSHILFCHSARDDAHLFRGDPNLCMTGVSVNGSTDFDGHDALWSHLQKPLSFCICTAGVVLCALLEPAPARAPKRAPARAPPRRRPWPPQSSPHTSDHPMVEGHPSRIDPHRPPLSRNTLKNQPLNADSDVSST